MRFVALTIIALVSSGVFADTKTFDRTWLGLFSKRKLAGTDYSIWTEGQARMDNERFTQQQLLLRPGVLKYINEKNDIGFLVAFSEMEKHWETRPTFQHAYKILKNVYHTLSYRSRFEYRVREDQDSRSGRYRGQLKYLRSLENKKGLLLWDELFVNLTNEDWTGNRIVERNRFFIGVELPFVDNTNFEVGYMNQYIPRETQSTVDHIAVVYYYY